MEYCPAKKREGKNKSDGIAKAPSEDPGGPFGAEHRLIEIYKLKHLATGLLILIYILNYKPTQYHIKTPNKEYYY